MAITNATVVPRLYAARLIAAYEEVRVHAARTNRAWQSMLAMGGDSIRVSSLIRPTIGDYNPTATPPVAYTPIDAAKKVDIELGYQKYFGGKLNDISVLQSRPDLFDEYTRLAGEELAKQVDADVRTEMVKAGAFTAGPDFALDMSTAFTANSFKFPMLHRMMDNANVPMAGRWIIMGPYSAEAMRTYALQNAVIDAAPNQGLVNGRVGMYGGFNIYVESDANSNFDDDSGNGGANATASEDWLIGNDSSMAFVDQIGEVESVRLPDDFANAIRGLYTYGCQSIWPDRLFKSTVSISKIPV